MKLINIGFGNMLAAERIVAIVNPDSAPVKRMVSDMRDQGLVVDATQGRKTRAVIQTDSKLIVLSALQPETIGLRASAQQESPANSKEE